MHWLWIVFHQLLQIARYGSLQLGPSIVKSAQSSLKSHRIDGSLSVHSFFVEHLLFLFEAPEVVLDEESSVELAYGHLVIDW